MSVARPVNAITGHTLKVTWPRVVRSEWIKVRSLRSTWWSLAATVFVMIALAALTARVLSNHPEISTQSVDGQPPMTGASVTIAGMQLAQLVVAVLGVLSTAGEHSTGMIRTTLSAVRSRVGVLLAKGVVIAIVTFVVVAPATLFSFYVGQWILGDQAVSIGDSGVLRSLIGQAIYLVGIAVMGVAIGELIRTTAGAITSLFGLLLVLPGVVQVTLSPDWVNRILPYLPSEAGTSFSEVTAASNLLSPAAGGWVFAAWVAGLFVLAAISLHRRDA